MRVVPALRPFNVAFTEVCPDGIETNAGLQKAIVSATARLIVTVDALGLLRKIGTDVDEPRPMPSVSRPNEMMAGPLLFTLTTEALDVILPDVAVMFDEPIDTPVTTPVVALIVATDGVPDANVKLPPEMYRPLASLPRAIIDVVPVMPTVAVGGVSSTLASTCATVSVALPVTPCAEAWMLVTPLAAAVARPCVGVVESMAATDPFVELQANVMPVIGLSSVSRASARYRRAWPSAVIVKLSGAGAFVESNDTSMRVIGVSTVTCDTPTVDPLVARTCVEPMVTPVATPLAALIDATDGVTDDHANAGCDVMGTLRPSTACAVKVKVPVGYSDREDGLTVTLAMRCCTTIRAESFVPPVSVATMYALPFATDVTRPLAFTVAAAALRLTQVHVPLTSVPPASRPATASCRVSVNEVRVSSRGVTVVVASGAGPVPPVAVTVIGDPVNPVDVMVSDCAPPAPRVQLVLAVPAAVVDALAGVTEPPPVATANCTLRPVMALPCVSVTFATIACASAVPKFAVWLPPDCNAMTAAGPATTSKAFDVAATAPVDPMTSVYPCCATFAEIVLKLTTPLAALTVVVPVTGAPERPLVTVTGPLNVVTSAFAGSRSSAVTVGVKTTPAVWVAAGWVVTTQ